MCVYIVVDIVTVIPSSNTPASYTKHSHKMAKILKIIYTKDVCISANGMSYKEFQCEILLLKTNDTTFEKLEYFSMIFEE